jgi:hypothetical protein
MVDKIKVSVQVVLGGGFLIDFLVRYPVINKKRPTIDENTFIRMEGGVEFGPQ